MSNKHTPGPWGELTMFDHNLTIGIDYPEGDDRDHYLAEVTCGDPDELEANARLIAAAPDLLAALQGIQSAWDENRLLTSDEAAAMRTAITKAIGA